MSAKILLYNEISKIHDAPHNALVRINATLSYRPKGFQYTPAYKQKKWDGTKYLFWQNELFPTGLTGMVCDALSLENVPFTLEDRRSKPKSEDRYEFTGEDRDYQDIEDHCIDVTRGIINFATGSGKTAVAARIIAKLGLKTLYIVPTKELLYQSAEDLKRYLNAEVGIVGDGTYQPEHITVATIQTISSIIRKKHHVRREEAMKLFSDIDVLFIDEAHHLGASSYYQTANEIKAYYKYGLTGTALRSDGSDMLLRAATGKIIARIGSSELIEKKVLSELDVKLFQIYGNLKASGWEQIYTQGIVYNMKRNRQVSELVLSYIEREKSVLIIVDRLETWERVEQNDWLCFRAWLY